MGAQQAALRINGAVGKAMERLSSGLKLNRGADDPSGLGIAAKTKAQIRGINVAVQNVEESIKLYTLRDAYLEQDQQLVARARDLAVRSANEAPLTDAQRAVMQDEVEGILAEINRLTQTSYKVGGARLLFAPTKLDVIWVLDTTASMDPAALTLFNAAGNMYNQFQNAGFDLRMMVTPFGEFAPGTNPGGRAISQTYGPFSVSWDFQRSSAAFQNDIATIRNIIPSGWGGGTERGLDAIDASITQSLPGGAFEYRTDVGIKKFMILLTDEDADDFNSIIDDPTLTAGAGPAAVRTALTNRLAANDITLDVVAQCRYAPWPSPDLDYSVVATNPAVGGMALDLSDTDSGWVSTITNSLLNQGSDWNAQYQVGPDRGHNILETFHSVTAGTMNADGINVSTATLAQNGITTANNAINWLSDERAKTAEVVKRLQHVANDLAAQSIGESSFESGLVDADMAQEVTGLTINQILSNTVVAAQAQANANPQAAAQLITTVQNAESVDQYNQIFTIQKA